jgi:hypothetical protein
MNDVASAVFAVKVEVVLRTFLTCSGKWYCIAPAIKLDGWGATEKEAVAEIARQLKERNEEVYRESER